jgi:hypothetical protein
MDNEQPHDAGQACIGNGTGCAAAGPAPVPEYGPPDPGEPSRRFVVDGQEWLAWVAGTSVVCIGALGIVSLHAVHFALGTAPEQATRQAYVPVGRFVGLFDEELVELHASALPPKRSARLDTAGANHWLPD